jgi:predicted Zn finger-like uncharacterized protein
VEPPPIEDHDGAEHIEKPPTAAEVATTTATETTTTTTPIEIPDVLSEAVTAAPEAGVAPAVTTAAEEETATVTITTKPSTPTTYVRCANCQSVYYITPADIGSSAGRRLECSLCGHAWYQSKERILTLNDDFLSLVPLNARELDRMEMNRQEGKPIKFIGDKKLYVGNVAFEAHEEDFFQVFGQFGIVGDVSLVRDDAGKIRGYGFVTMRTADGADLALQQAATGGGPGGSGAGPGLCVRGRELAVRESTN